MVAKIENLVHYMLNYKDGDMLCLGVRFFDRTAYNKAVEYLEKTKTDYKDLGFRKDMEFDLVTVHYSKKDADRIYIALPEVIPTRMCVVSMCPVKFVD